LNAINNDRDGSPLGKNRNSGQYEPRADRKKSTPAIMRDFFLPILEAHIPEIAAPITHPINALDDVIPCMKSVYSKSSAPMKNT